MCDTSCWSAWLLSGAWNRLKLLVCIILLNVVMLSIFCLAEKRQGTKSERERNGR